MTINLPQLTFTRFVAASLVVFFHFGQSKTSLSVPFLGQFIPFFSTLVSYFFVLSGFLLTVSTNTKSEGQRRSQFWINRIARVCPLYWFALVVSLIVLFFENLRDTDMFTTDYFFTSVLTNIFLLQSWFPDKALSINYPAWSLSVEAFLYLLFPFLYQSLIGRSTFKICTISLLLWVATQVIYFYLRIYTPLLPNTAFVPILHVATFVTGISSGILFIRYRARLVAHGQKLNKFLILAVIGCFALILSRASLIWYHEAGLFTPVFALFILVMSVRTNRFTQLMSLPVLVYLGEISYSIYLLQVPVSSTFYALNKAYLHLTNESAFFIFLFILMGVSAICYEKIEKPWRTRIKVLLTSRQPI